MLKDKVSSHKSLLEVHNLKIQVPSRYGKVTAVSDVSFHIEEKETVALVGESGCGKTLTASAIIGIFSSDQITIDSGSIIYQGKEITHLTSSERKAILGKEISFIPQNPLSSLNPTLKIGYQLTEAIKESTLSRNEKEKLAAKMLYHVGFSEPEKRLSSFPHELSGGMRQRVLIAMALINNPKLIILDEPTTALDVTIQAQILDLLKSLQKQFSMSMLFITHDMGIVAQVADRVAVMYAGSIVETGTTNEIFYSPIHPYTQALLHCMPRIDREVKQSLISIPGTPPVAGDVIERCPFATRCPHAMHICSKMQPPLYTKSTTHSASCFMLTMPKSKIHTIEELQKKKSPI